MTTTDRITADVQLFHRHSADDTCQYTTAFLVIDEQVPITAADDGRPRERFVSLLDDCLRKLASSERRQYALQIPSSVGYDALQTQTIYRLLANADRCRRSNDSDDTSSVLAAADGFEKRILLELFMEN